MPRALQAIAIAAVVATVAPAHADQGAPPPAERQPIVGFRVRGHSKVTDRTAEYLSHMSVGDPVGPADLAALQEAFLSSELFEQVSVSLEPTTGGVLVVATVDDKHSWIIAPTVYVLPSNQSFGVGFAENDLGGRNQKMLLYGQLGTTRSLLFATFLDPSVRGTRWITRYDLYAYHRDDTEYANPVDDPTSTDIARITTTTYLGGGILLGYRLAWWLTTDFRLRGGYLYFRDSHVGDGAARMALPHPEIDGRDISAQAQLTLDHRFHRYGVTWGPYVNLMLDKTIPGLDQYGYALGLLRAYYSWRFFGEHELELRGILHVGYHLPFHEEITLGGESDLRGYATDQFRGDVRTLFRAEYSLPITRWRWFAFRAIGFWDTGYSGNQFLRTTSDRNLLPSEYQGVGWWRNDVGAGLRVYVSSVVLPLLGLDFGYGIEGHSPEIYFEVGLTDF